MPSKRPCGIALSSASSEGRLIYLPLEQLDVHSEIVDVSATVTFTQKFWQCSPTPTSRAKYVFPIPARAAVCGFEMRTEDGRVVKAVAKEKETARAEHEQAIEQGKLTGLVEYVTGDIFTISLGSLPQLQMITTKLTYVMDLMEDDFADQVRLLLPHCIGWRYGTTPPGMVGAKVIPPERIRINVDVYMKGAIQSITSPSHPTFIMSDSGVLPSASSICRKNALYISQDFLSADLMLSVKAEGLDAPRCFAERGPTGSLALQLTVVPKLGIPNIAAQEYIFLVDRSGSMNGKRIATAKRALVMLLRALPASGTIFNIFSFGSRCDSLWPESQKYGEESLQAATAHVDSMAANYGGTEIRAALEQVFTSRCIPLPTACFVLTDGNAYDVDATLKSVADAVVGARPEAPLRVFTLGIGESTSTALCEGIARAGNGICLMAVASDAIVAKCSKLVKCSRSEILNDVTVDWGVSAEPVAPSEKADPQAAVLRQGPYRLPLLYSGCRFVVFAIIQNENFVVPEQVILRAKRTGSTESIVIPVPVELLQPTAAQQPQRPLIHTLAARRMITELEDPNAALESNTKATIIHLGEQYQLASRFTSFIAVEDKPGDRSFAQREHSPSPTFTDRYGAMNALHMAGAARGGTLMNALPMAGAARGGTLMNALPMAGAARGGTLMNALPMAGAARGGTFGAARGGMFGAARPVMVGAYSVTDSAVPQMPALLSPGGSPPPPSVPMAPMAAGPASPPPAAFGGALRPASMAGAVRNSVDVSRLRGKGGYARHAPKSELDRERVITVSASSAQSYPHSAASSRYGSVTESVAPNFHEDDVMKLVRLQSFDGSFPVSAALVSILGQSALDAKKEGLSPVVWATILAAAYLRKHLVDQPELLEGLVEKAIDHIRGASNADVDGLLREASTLVP